MTGRTSVALLAGGFGGARMAHGFAQLPDRVALTVIGNTADDLELHGLHISPDLDTVMYTLAGLVNTGTGWGVRDETWSAAEMLERYRQPIWFRLGDRDLATHVTRTARLRDGQPLTTVTAELCAALGIRARLLPMTDDAVATKVRTASGWLDFQDYFVRRRHADDVLELRFEGVEQARPSVAVCEAIATAGLLVIAPSNPFVSVAPILAVPGLLECVRAAPATVIAVSPIVGGAALRGPAAQMLSSLAGQPATSAGIARYYAATYPGLVDALVIDESDSAEASDVAATGIRPLVLPALISADDDRRRLAEAIIAANEAAA